MGQPLVFELTLTETFGAKLGGSVNPALEQANKLLGSATVSVRTFEGSLSQAVSGAGEKASRFFTFDLAHGAEIAIDAIKEVGRAFFDLGKDIVKTAAEAQDINLALKLNVGEPNVAQYQELADKFAKATGYDDDKFKKAWLPLLESGLKNKDLLSDITAAAVDLKTRTAGTISVEEAIDAFHKVGLKGEIDPKILRALNIGQAEFYEDLGKKFQITGERAKELASKGKLDKVDLINATLDAVAKREGGSLGGAALDAGKTMGSTLQRLQDAPGNMFKKIAEGTGMKNIQGFLDNIVAVMTGDIGTTFVTNLDHVFGTLFGDLSGPDGLGKMQGILVSIGDQFSGLVKKFQEAWPSIKEGASDVWDVFKNLADTIGLLAGPLELLGKTIGLVFKGFHEYVQFKKELDAGRIQRDIIDTVTGAHGGLSGEEIGGDSPMWKKKGLGGASNYVAGVQEGLDAHSPSRKLIALGMNASEGFAIGLDNGLDEVSAARRRLSDTATAAADGSGLVAGGGKVINFSPVFHFGGVAGDEQKLAQLAAESVRVEFLKLMNELEAATGAAEAA